LACATPLPAVAPSAGEERKLVTVLFCDLVGFTARSDNADPEDVRATLRPYHARLRQEIERFGGTVEKFIGDAVMAVFGAPVAHEDDAERAVRAALRIVEAIADLNGETPGLDLAVRVGINTGEAVVALGARPLEGEGIVTGDVVNTAARLQTVAPVGGIVVGEVTYRATGDLISYEALPPVDVKGKAASLPIWLAVGARSRFGVDVEQGSEAPFVGRDRELALLQQTFERAVGDPSVQLVTVAGEPGVGKTRLLWELRGFVDDLPDLVFWRQGRCLPYGEGITFWALGEMVKGQAGILESDTPQQAAEKIEAAVDAVVEDRVQGDWLRVRLGALVGAADGGEDHTQTADRDETFTAWRTFLEAVAARRPLVLVFEDLHWADQAMLEFVEYLVEWSTDVPLLVVCSARPELYERHPGWGGGKRNSTTVSLSPLSDQDTSRLLSALLSQAVLPAEVQTTLLERAGGNPLYAEEFVRMLSDRGFLERHGRTLRLTADRASIPLPESVQSLIAARLDTLPAARKALLHDASVVGKVFWSGALASMGRVDDRTVRDGLHELARKELVRTTRVSSMKEQAEYSFWHALVRDVAYGQIPRAQRAAKHRAAAVWIEEIAGERAGDQAELLAYHAEQAMQLTAATGASPDPADVERTIRFLTLAGDRALRLDVRKAHEFFQRALDLAGPDHPEHPTLLIKSTDAAWALGAAPWPAVEAAMTQAIDELRDLGRTLEAGAALRTLALYLRVQGETDRGEAILDQAIQSLESHGETPELASAYATRAGNDMLAGRIEECLRWTERCIDLAERLELPEIHVRALQYRGIVRILTGDPEGLEDLRQSLRTCLELGLGPETATAYVNVADWTSEMEHAGKGLELYLEGIVFAERRGQLATAAWMRGETTWRLFDLGEWDEVIRTADELEEWSRSRGMSQPVVIALTMKALVLVNRGEVSGAAAAMDVVLPAAREIKDTQVYIPALTTAALVAVAQDRRSDLHDVIEELDGAVGLHPSTQGYAAPWITPPLIAAGELRRAAEWCAFAETPPPSFAAAKWGLAMARAQLAEAEDRLEEALEGYGRAALGWEEMGYRVSRVQCLFGLGRCLARLGRSSEALEALREARVAFAGMGARPAVAEVDGWLQGLEGDAQEAGSR